MKPLRPRAPALSSVAECNECPDNTKKRTPQGRVFNLFHQLIFQHGEAVAIVAALGFEEWVDVLGLC